MGEVTLWFWMGKAATVDHAVICPLSKEAMERYAQSSFSNAPFAPYPTEPKEHLETPCSRLCDIRPLAKGAKGRNPTRICLWWKTITFHHSTWNREFNIHCAIENSTYIASNVRCAIESLRCTMGNSIYVAWSKVQYMLRDREFNIHCAIESSICVARWGIQYTLQDREFNIRCAIENSTYIARSKVQYTLHHG